MLMRRKGGLTLDPRVARMIETPGCDVLPAAAIIDSEIERIGGPPVLTRRISDPAEFAAAMATAMQADIAEVERNNPGKTNIVLCGGKDSLNLLLAEWSNKVIAYSAAPNFTLVRDFVSRNKLDIEVRELLDTETPDLLDREIAEACGMVDLENWKWAGHLARIAHDLDRQAVFWKGQFADAFMTDYWRSYTSSHSAPFKYLKKGYRKAARLASGLLGPLFDGMAIEDFRDAIWNRGAVAQGAHLGMLRSITDCLFVSAYHGRRTAQVWLSGDYPRIATSDLRPAVGARLLGRAAIYPTDTPSPPVSPFRRGLRTVAAFETALETCGLKPAPAASRTG